MKLLKSTPCAKMAFLGLFSTMLSSAHASIPEPDNLLYGSITLDNVTVTAARTDVVIEARPSTNGPAIASYRMGDDPALGDFYSLRIPVESLLPLSNTNSFQVGDHLFITLLDGSGLRAQTSFTVLERGVVQRVDFGAVVTDGDGDGLPDAWELLHYSNLTQTPDSLAANGQTAWQHYLAGTDPTDPDGGFKIHIALSNGLARVSFVAQRAEGPGYEGTTRLYSLETNPGLDAPSWVAVPGFIDVPGDNQTVAYNSSGLGNPAFYRGKISLTGINVPGNDVDGDGLPDAWELLHYSNLTQTPDSPAADGQTAWQHYLAGTDPNDADGGFKIHIALINGHARVLFFAQRAEGPGYEGATRLYSLQTKAGLDAPSWTSVPGFIDVPGDNQTVAFDSSGLGNLSFFRGKITLMGINVPGNDVDRDGLPDAWENLNFANLNQTADSINLNGQTALQNFVAGTDPNDPGSVFKLTATHSAGTQSVSFFAMSAQGLGYEGRQRFYALESSTNPSGPWIGVPAVSNVLANDQTVTYPVSSSATPAFYRGRVCLQP